MVPVVLTNSQIFADPSRLRMGFLGQSVPEAPQVMAKAMAFGAKLKKACTHDVLCLFACLLASLFVGWAGRSVSEWVGGPAGGRAVGRAGWLVVWLVGLVVGVVGFVFWDGFSVFCVWLVCWFFSDCSCCLVRHQGSI